MESHRDLYLDHRLNSSLLRGKMVQYADDTGSIRDKRQGQPSVTSAQNSRIQTFAISLMKYKNLNEPTKFKARLRHFLVSRVFYSVQEFMMSRWDEI
ncbi:hypothetical protein J6590_045698 [Homalodisca vitripennis]|nr:hypothetical protein J6590_045698 [Homalodisca vitripennis]